MPIINLRVPNGIIPLTNQQVDDNFQNIINAIGAAGSTTIPTPTGTVGPVLSNSPTLTGTMTTNNIHFQGTLVGDTAVIAIGTTQIYKDVLGNVSLGNNSPEARLDIVTTAGRLFFDAASTSNLISSVDLTNTALSDLQINALTIELQTDTTSRLHITNAGYIGVGTNTPAVKLDVYGDVNIGSSLTSGNNVSTGDAKIDLGGLRTGSGNSFIDFHSIASTDFEARIIRGGTANGNFQLTNTGTGNFDIYQTGAAPIKFSTSGTQRAYISALGNVGIGNTPSETYKLEVTGKISSSLNVYCGDGSGFVFGPLGTTYITGSSSTNSWGMYNNSIQRLSMASNGRLLHYANSEQLGVQLNYAAGSTNGPFLGSAGADIFTISTSAGVERFRNNALGGSTFYTPASGFVKISATEAPTVDLLQIINTGFPIVSGNIHACRIDYVGGAGVIECAASKINLSAGTTSGSIWNGFRLNPTTGAAAGVTQNAIRIDSVTSDTGSDNAFFVGTGWDSIINYAGTTLISGTGAAAFTTISASGQITSTVATGAAPFVVSSTTNVANLNASTLSGATFANPGSIGNSTASTGAFTTLTSTGAITFNTTTNAQSYTTTGAGTITISSGTLGSINNMTVGASTASTGAFTTLSASSTVSGTGFSTYLASPPAIGSSTASTGAFTTLSASSTVSGTGFSTYLASPPAIGSSTASTGAFTTLSASSTVSGTGFSTYLASPPAIGSSTASTGAFTTLTATGHVFTTQAIPDTATITATLTIAQLLTLSIQATPPSAPVTYTLPTGSDIETSIGASVAVGMGFEWSIINLGGFAITVSAGASGHTIPVAIGTIAAGALNTPVTATFRTRKTSTNNYTTYRI